MQSRKQSSGYRSPLAFVTHRGVTVTSPYPGFLSSGADAAYPERFAPSRSDVHAYQQNDLRRTDGCRVGEGRAIQMRPQPGRSWRVIPAVVFGLSARAVGGFAACGDIAFSGFLFAFMSWTIAQVLAGCAAYAQAMYPCAIEDDPHEREAIPTGAPNEPVPPPRTRKHRSGAAAPVVVEYVARSRTPRVDPPDWAASIAAFWKKFRSGIGRELAWRLTVAELRALDDRSLRDVGLSRCDIEHIAKHGDRFE